MLRSLVLAVLISFAASPLAADWRFDGQYHWRGTQAYRVTRKSCGGYNYQKVYPQKQSSYVSTVGDSLTVTNVYNLQQPAAVGGSTAFGYLQASYSDLNLAALLSHNGRIIEQGYAGVQSLAGQFGQNLSLVASIEAERSRSNQIIATGQAAATIAQAVQPPPGAPINVQSQQTYQSGYGGQQGGYNDGPPARPRHGGGGIDGLNPLLAQHCASCHSRDGGTARQDAIERFNMDDANFGYPTREQGIIAAGRSLTSDNPAKRMPLNIEIDAQTRGNLIQAWLGQ